MELRRRSAIHSVGQTARALDTTRHRGQFAALSGGVVMYSDWISYWAKLGPQNIAVVLPQGSIGYAGFDEQINKGAARLAALAIPPRTRVGVRGAVVCVHCLCGRPCAR